MAADRHDGDSTRELRLEGIGLLLGGGFLLALIVGAFFLGRWVERQTGPLDAQTPDGAGPLAQIAAREPDADAAEGITYFDSLEGAEKEVESRREIPTQTPPRPTSSPPETAVAEPAAQVEDGRFYVQVLALRDQYAAAEVIESLKAKGYGVRLFPEREGQGTLYKVRVGGYATREEASDARDGLRRAGHPGAFVWPAG